MKTMHINKVIGNLQRSNKEVQDSIDAGLTRREMIAIILRIAQVFEGVIYSYNEHKIAWAYADEMLTVSYIDI